MTEKEEHKLISNIPQANYTLDIAIKNNEQFGLTFDEVIKNVTSMSNISVPAFKEAVKKCLIAQESGEANLFYGPITCTVMSENDITCKSPVYKDIQDQYILDDQDKDPSSWGVMASMYKHSGKILTGIGGVGFLLIAALRNKGASLNLDNVGQGNGPGPDAGGDGPGYHLHQPKLFSSANSMKKIDVSLPMMVRDMKNIDNLGQDNGFSSDTNGDLNQPIFTSGASVEELGEAENSIETAAGAFLKCAAGTICVGASAAWLLNANKHYAKIETIRGGSTEVESDYTNSNEFYDVDAYNSEALGEAWDC